MTLVPAPLRGFNGLDLTASADEARGAIDGQNFDLSERGALRPRYGREYFVNGVAGSGTARTIWGGRFWNNVRERLLVPRGTTMYLYDGSGSQLSTQSLTGSTDDFTYARMGVVESGQLKERVYFGNEEEPLRYLDVQNDGTNTFAAPTVSNAPFGGYEALGVTPWDNRLVAASGSQISFSEPGVPANFTAAAGEGGAINVYPGDGERFVALVSFRQELVAFKWSKIVVFYGTRAEEDGTPIFDWRLEDYGVGALSRHHVCVAEDGIYFLSAKGLYRMRGIGEPERISDPIEGAIMQTRPEGQRAAFFTGTTFGPADYQSCHVASAVGRVFLFCPGSTSAFAYHVREGYWSYFQFSGSETLNGATGWATEDYGASQDDLYMAATNSGTVNVHRWPRTSLGYADEVGNPTVKYRTPFLDFGSDSEKRIREVVLHGTGTVSVKSSADFGSLSSGTSLALSNTVPPHYRDTSKAKGQSFSWEISASGGSSFAVERFVPMLASQRVEPVQS